MKPFDEEGGAAGPEPRTRRLSSSGQEVLKWTAILLMLLDHVAVTFLEGGPYLAARLLGRLSFPLFAFLVAYNLTARRVDARRYLGPMLLIGAVSQPAFAFLFERSSLNIFAPLLAGVVLTALIVASMEGRTPFAGWPGTIALGVALAAVCALWADYGLQGALITPAWALFLLRPSLAPALLLAATLMSLNWGWVGWLVPLLTPGVVFLVAVVVPAGSVSRMPRWLWYLFYPLHLAVLGLIRAVV